jgi:hypothetical protein
MFRNSLLVIEFVLIDDQRIAIVDRIKNIAQILYLENIFKR